MAENKGVMICGEIVDGKMAAVTTELLGGGRKVADELGEDLSAVLMGSGVSDFAKEAIAYGADKVYVIDDPLLKDYQTDSYTAVMEKLVKEVAPKVLLMGQTPMGRDLAPRLGFRLGVGVSTDCIELGVDPESKLPFQTRPVYGGNARAIFSCELFPQMATVRPKTMSSLERDDSRQGEVVTFDTGIDASMIRTKVLDRVKEEVTGIKLEDADVIVSGGRGIGGPEPFEKELKELADVLGGAVGASRPPADNGWVGEALHIGLTGKIVAPTVYIAIAISGASQHMSGCTGSKNIIAINKDSEANIFKEARFGIVADYKQALPAFTEKVKELMAG
jgi:electron transfer flavoprotein alpha subunit